MYPDPSRFIADAQLVSTLLKQSISIPCYRECVLFRQGDAPVGLYILVKGSITLSTKSLELGFVIALHSTPSLLLDLPRVVRNESHDLTAVAHRGTQLSFIGREEFMGLITSDSVLSTKILRMLADGVNMARRAFIRSSLVDNQPVLEFPAQSLACPISNPVTDSQPRRTLDW